MVADNRSVVDEAGAGREAFLRVFDALSRREDCSEFEDQDLVAKLAQRIEALKASFTKDYEL